MLKSLGFADDEIPTLLVHGWWNIRSKTGESEKMSKTLGNVVDPDVLADRYGTDAVRLHLTMNIAMGRDADFSEAHMVQTYNSVLANSLGNLLNRSLNMSLKYRNSVLRKSELLPLDVEHTAFSFLDNVILNYNDGMVGRYERRDGTKENPDIRLAPFEINFAFANSLRIAHRANGFVDLEAPWKLAKDPEQTDRLDAVLYALAESLRVTAILIAPFLPKAAHGIFDQLNWKMDLSGQEKRFSLADAVWGGLPDGHQLGHPTPLFPRIEVPAPE
jgi:methionyl-tRNA synthetase